LVASAPAHPPGGVAERDRVECADRDVRTTDLRVLESRVHPICPVCACRSLETPVARSSWSAATSAPTRLHSYAGIGAQRSVVR